MAIIHVPRPKPSSMNPKRPASSLLMTQVEHMHVAEKRLPLRYRTEIYVNAIKTEGEAAEYIAKATAAIHQAHSDAAKRRIPATPKPGRLLKIAATADDGPASQSKQKMPRAQSKATGTAGKTSRSKSKSRRKK